MSNIKYRLKNKGFATPELAAHFAEEKADGQQVESGRSAKNTSPVVMQVLSQSSGESLGEETMLVRFKTDLLRFIERLHVASAA